MLSYVNPNLWKGCVGAWCPSQDRSRSTRVTDFSGSNNHGTLTNMDPATDWVASQGKIALDIDQVDDYVDCGVVRDQYSNGISISAFISRPTFSDNNHYYNIFSSRRGSDNVTPFSLDISNNISGGIGSLRFYLNNGGFFIWVSSVSLYPRITESMLHVAVTYTPGSNPRMFLNGIEDLGVTRTSGASNPSILHTATTQCIGNFIGALSPDLPLGGQIDDVLIYNRALAPAEIATLARRRGIAYETNRIRRYFIATSVHSLVADSISLGAPSIGSPVLAQVHALVALGIVAGAPAIGQSTIAQVHVLSANAIAVGSPVVGQSTIAQVHVLSPSSVETGAPIVGQSTLSQAHSLSASGITTGSPVVGQSTLSQVHVLSCGVIETGAPIVGTASMSGSVALSADGITTGSPIVGQSTLSQVHSLVSVSVVTGSPIVGQATLSQVHVLVANSIAAGPPVVGQSTLSIVVIATGIYLGQVVCYRQDLVAYRNSRIWASIDPGSGSLIGSAIVGLALVG